MAIKYYDSTDKKDIPTTNIVSKTKGVFDKIKNEKDQINMKISNEAYIELVSKNLYGDTTAFIREFVANEARQVKESMKLGNKDAHILITIDGYTRKIIIEGINSMGISTEEFDRIYRYYGRTGNNDGTSSGQFGIGKASYLLVADTILIESWSQKTDEKFHLLGKSGVLFEEMPISGMKLKKYGTRFTVVAKENIDLKEICKYCNNLGKLLGVPLYMNLVADSKDFSTSYFEYNDLTPGMNMISKTDVKKHLLEVSEMSDDNINNSSYIYIDTDDYTLEGIASGYCKYNHNLNYPHDVRLVGIPINAFDLSVSLHGVFTLNVKDERKFRPVSSRDSFTVESQNKLRELVQKDILNYYIDKIKDIKDLDTYLKSENKSFFNDMIPNDFLNNGLTNTTLASIIKLKFDGYFKNLVTTSFRDSLYNMQSYLNKETNIMYAKSTNLTLIERTLAIDGNVIILILKKWKKDKKFVEKLENCGITSLSKFLKSKKIKAVRLKKTDITVYSFHGIKTSMDLSNLPRNIIVVPNDVRITNIIKNINHEYNKSLDNVIFVKEYMAQKISADKTVNLIELETLVNKIFSTKFTTSRGRLTGKAIHNKHFSVIRPIITNDDVQSTKITMDHVEKITNYDNYLIIQDKKKRICGITIPPLYLLPLANRYANSVSGGWDYLRISDLSSVEKKNIKVITKIEESGISIPGGHSVYEWDKTWNILSGIKNKYLRDVVMLKFYEHNNNGWDGFYRGLYKDYSHFNSLKIFTMIDSKTEGMDRDQTRNAILNMEWNNGTKNGIPSVLKYLIFEDIAGEFTDNKKDLSKYCEHIQTGLNYMSKNQILNTKVICELKYNDRNGFDIHLTFDNIDGFVFENTFILAHLLPYYKDKKDFLDIKTVKHVKPNGIEITLR